MTAASLEFDTAVYHSLGANAVALWNFDENRGTTAYDTSGNNNNAVLSASGAVSTTGVSGSALAFSGGNGYATISSDANTLNTYWTK